MKIIFLLVTALAIAPIVAQERRVPAPPSPRAGVQRVPSPSARSSQTNAEALAENHTIHLHGMTSAGIPVDLSLTGIGPEFSADTVLDDDFSVLNCRFLVTQIDDRPVVDFAISVRVRVPTQTSGDAVSYSYQEVSTSGRAVTPLGKPLVIAASGKGDLVLTMTRTGDHAGQGGH